jgi:undecaprenyl-diphosphatase
MIQIKRLIIFIVGVAIFWVIYFFFYGNFHKVDKDVYRSAQLFSYNFPYYLEEYQIKSILNLRKVRKEKEKRWYRDEVSIAKKMDVIRYDYPIGDRAEASMEQMDQIVKIIKEAPKPILIHCKAGADRTSLASALYMYAIKKDIDAEKQISIIYGHFPWLGSKTSAMDRSFKRYKNAK